MYCIVQAHNGSGKTTCFTLAMLSRVDPAVAQPQAICVCPTRCSLDPRPPCPLQHIGPHMDELTKEMHWPP